MDNLARSQRANARLEFIHDLVEGEILGEAQPGT